VRYGSIGGLEYEVPQSRLYCLCINVAVCLTALQCICRVIRRSSMTKKAHTYYIIFGRPPIGGKLPPWRRHCSAVISSVTVAVDSKNNAVIDRTLRPRSSSVRPLACNWYYCAQLVSKPKAACALRFSWAATSSNLGL